MTVLCVRLFGGLALAWDDDPLPTIPGTAARSLFAYLVTYRDRPHTRNLLAGAFWLDLPDATGRRRLSKALWQIRHAFRAAAPKIGREGQDKAGPLSAVLVTEGDTVQLNPDLAVWVDREEFEQQAITSRQRKFALAVDGLLRAAELYRGEFLAGYYDDWAVVERERLQGMLLEALGRLVAGYKERGEYEPALRSARRLAAEEPWREGAHREVMQLCHLLGEDADALKQFDICRQSLTQELGVEPSPETVAVANEIAAKAGLARPPLLPAAARPVTAPLLERPDRLPLVGRRKELAELLRQVEATVEGTGDLTIIHGEAGVGKSRLLREVEVNARWRGVRTAWGRCYELTAPPAYQPLVEALRGDPPALDESALEPLWRAELSRILPELATSEGPPPPLSPEEERRRLLEAIARGFLALADTAPSLVLLEDAQWMDPASLEALRYLLPRLGEAPLLVVVTARAEELEGQRAEVLSSMESTRLARRLELGPLSRAETEELVQRALGLEEPAPRFSARLYAETEGNPFFLIDTLWALVEEGLLYRDETGAWSTQWDESTEDYAELPLPPGVVQSIERRLDRLPSGLNELLDLAAVIGRGVRFEQWLSASGWEEEALLVAGEALCARGLLLTSEPDYVFAHDQIRRVAYQRLAPPRRRLYHRRVAEALVDLAPGEPATLAHHWTRAEVWDRAADYHQQAGDQARSVYANAEAVDHYGQALACLERQPGAVDPLRRYELYLAREMVSDVQGWREAQAEDLRALEVLSDALDDDAQRAVVALRRAAYLEATGDYPLAIRVVKGAVRWAQAAGNVGLEAASRREWGTVLRQQGDHEAAYLQIEKALGLARDALLTPVEAECLHNLGLVAYRQGDYKRARDHLIRSLHISRAIGDRRGEGNCLDGLGMVSRFQGEFEESRDYAEQALHVRREVGDRLGEAQTLLLLGNVSYFQGNYGEAMAYYQQCWRILREIGHRRGQIAVLNDMGAVYRLQGDSAAARAHYEQALLISRELGDRYSEGGLLGNLGQLALGQGEFAASKSYFERALHLSRETNFRLVEGEMLNSLGDLFRRLGDYTQARTYIAESLRTCYEIGDRQGESAALSQLSLLFHHLGDHQTSQDLSQQAINIVEQTGERSRQGYALTNLGHAQLGRGRLADATATYRQAAELRRELGEHHLAMESLAGLAQAFLAQGDLAMAQSQVQEILAHLETGTLQGTEEPLQVYLTCYQVLRASSDLRAQGVLTAAYELLQEQAASIGDEALKRSFLEDVAVNREIAAAYCELQSVPQGRRTVSLPRADAPLGRPLREDEYLAVTWTVDDPGDEAIGGKVARRRHRILRLLREAQDQGAAPTHSHLAEALGVSRRTIERDMTALHREHPDLPPTRGKMSE